jgi:radical SAM-linked protein
MFRQRIRIQYRVEGDKRFLSHHDTMRLWHRVLRRSGLPLRMTEGFHVRPRMSFALARGVGIASESEWLEFELADWVNPDTVAQALARQLPDGLTLRQIDTVAPSQRALAVRARYRIDLAERPADLPQRVASLLARDRLPVERGDDDHRRQVDIRPLIAALECSAGVLSLTAECRPEGTLRPDEVLAGLGLTSEGRARATVTRTDLVLGD